MADKRSRVCPVEMAGSLDNKIRRWFQNPQKILKPYIQEGMRVLEVGCGPGFFTLDIAKMVGASGRVIAVDLQEGMLQKVQKKISGTELEKRIELHHCTENGFGIKQEVDFVLLFYVVHEIPNKENLFKELSDVLKPGGDILVVEPPMHVTTSEFNKMLEWADRFGLAAKTGPKMLLHKTVILYKN